MKTILLTGATGYIGSHTWCVLNEAGYRVIGVDNFFNSSRTVLPRIQQIIGKEPEFIEADIRDDASLRKIFTHFKVDAVIHFAALKSVSESISKPLTYYDNNVIGLIKLLDVMDANGVKKLVFSSSAVVYGDPSTVPVIESFPLKTNNPYGKSKSIGEGILHDIEMSDNAWRIGNLRYFNPVGAHESGLIGETPNGIPNNLMPYVAQVAIGNLAKLKIYGNDYSTPDGTGVRDYIHVMDLAKGHLKALSHLLQGGDSFTVNLGTGKGCSVYEVLRCYEKASKRAISFEVVNRRSGDIATCYAEVKLAQEILGWRAEKTLMDMCVDSWRWQCMNPSGL